MLRQPQSPRPEAQGVDTGGPQLLGNQGAIGGEATGKEKADQRHAMRLGGHSCTPPQWMVPKQGTGFKSSAALELGPPAPASRQVALGELPACSTSRMPAALQPTQAPTADPGHGTNGHMLAPSRGHPCPVLAEHGLVLGKPKMLSTSMGSTRCHVFPALPLHACFSLGTWWGRRRAGTRMSTAAFGR